MIIRNVIGDSFSRDIVSVGNRFISAGSFLYSVVELEAVSCIYLAVVQVLSIVTHDEFRPLLSFATSDTLLRCGEVKL